MEKKVLIPPIKPSKVHEDLRDGKHVTSPAFTSPTAH